MIMQEKGAKEPDNVIQILRLITLMTQKPQETSVNKPQIFNELLRIMKNIVDLKDTT